VLIINKNNWLLAIGLVGCLGLAAGSARAGEEGKTAITVYGGQGVNSDLIRVIPDMVTGKLQMEGAYLSALAWRIPLGVPGLFRKIGISNTGIELIGVKHYGLETNWESDIAYVVRFPLVSFWGWSIYGGVGMGFAYAFSRPSYEDGPKGNPDKRYWFQNYDAFELEWKYTRLQNWAIVTRLHHRSGMYGLIAPRRVGSNFITLGIRYWL
jgi:hypothetical protein